MQKLCIVGSSTSTFKGVTWLVSPQPTTIRELPVQDTLGPGRSVAPLHFIAPFPCDTSSSYEETECQPPRAAQTTGGLDGTRLLSSALGVGLLYQWQKSGLTQGFERPDLLVRSRSQGGRGVAAFCTLPFS